jgi:hypothetical protein
LVAQGFAEKELRFQVIGIGVQNSTAKMLSDLRPAVGQPVNRGIQRVFYGGHGKCSLVCW